VGKDEKKTATTPATDAKPTPPAVSPAPLGTDQETKTKPNDNKPVNSPFSSPSPTSIFGQSSSGNLFGNKVAALLVNQ
jgi:hypothetical protein